MPQYLGQGQGYPGGRLDLIQREARRETRSKVQQARGAP